MPGLSPETAYTIAKVCKYRGLCPTSMLGLGCQWLSSGCLNGVSHPSLGQALNHFRPFHNHFTPLKQRRGVTRANKALYSEDRRLREPSAPWLKPFGQTVPARRESFSKTRRPHPQRRHDARCRRWGCRETRYKQWQSRRLDTAHLVQPCFC